MLMFQMNVVVYSEDGDSRYMWTVRTYLPAYMLSHPRKWLSSYSIHIRHCNV